MSELLDQVDRDGAVREAADLVTRGGLLAGAGAVLGGALLGTLGRPGRAAAQARRDRAVLNYALTLEYLQAAFYTEAERVGALSGRAAAAAEVLGGVERAHVRAFRGLLGRDAVRRPTFDFRGTTEEQRPFLRKALGSAAVKKPDFDFGDTVTDLTKFKATAQVLEDTGVRAYLGQAGNIKQGAVLGAAGSILTVEARHAAWIRFINGGGVGADEKGLPAPLDFDKPASEKKILKAVTGTGFIQ